MQRPSASREASRSRMATAEIGVFGGSGFYSFLDDVEEQDLETPFGKPSAPVAIGAIGGKQGAFLPRHGKQHELPPHRIPYRANVWALPVPPSEPTGRAPSRAPTARTTHVSAADPFCPDLRRLFVETATELGIPVRDGGTVVVTQGPRFSTRAESRWFQGMDWDVINMTAYPECYLSRELELCYVNVSMVTDHDVGVEGQEPVSAEAVVRVFNENNERLRALLYAVIPKIGAQPGDVCATAL